MSIKDGLKHTFLLSCLFLFSCAKTPEYSPSSLSWPQREQQLSRMTDWQFRGDIFLKMAKHKLNASIYWRQKNDHYHIAFFGPFGLGAMTLDGQPGEVNLKDNHGKHFTADTPEALMQQQLGWCLPVSSLDYWARGLPSPHSIAQVHYDRFHRIDHLVQQGWSIDYLAYQEIQPIELPKEIVFSHANFSIDLVIEGDSWQVNR